MKRLFCDKNNFVTKYLGGNSIFLNNFIYFFYFFVLTFVYLCLNGMTEIWLTYDHFVSLQTAKACRYIQCC